MRVRAAVLGGVSVFVCALAWAASGSAAPRGAGAVCGPAHAKTFASNRAARVYSKGGNVYGCARTGDQSFLLGTVGNSFSEGRVGPVALAGVDVAYGLTTYGVDTVSAQVVVKSLTNGAVVRQESSWTGPVAAEFFQMVDAIVVKKDGSVAWIATAGSIISSNATTTEVEKSDHASGTLLDKSKQIKQHSLRLRGSKLTWKDGSATQRSTLQ